MSTLKWVSFYRVQLWFFNDLHFMIYFFHEVLSVWSQITFGAAVDLCFGNVPKSPELETYFKRSYDGPLMLKNNPLCLVVPMETCNSFIIAMDYKWVSITGLSASVLSHCCHNSLSSTNTARHSPCLYTCFILPNSSVHAIQSSYVCSPV